MAKPFYKKWIFWVIVIVVGGTIGLINGGEETVDPVNVSMATTETKEVTASEKSEPTKDPTAASTELPAVEETEIEVPAYTIIDERLDKSGMWYLTLSTESTDEAQLKALVENGRLLAIERGNEATAVFIDILHSDNNENIAKGKIALSKKGIAQTGLKDTSTIEFELIN